MTNTGRTKTAMILAAGLGTRLRPLTDNMPKALVQYKGTPMIETIMLKLKSAGFGRIVINVHHFADMIEEFVRSRNGFGLDVAFSDERDLLRDTGGGIRHAFMSGLIGQEPVLVHNVDIITSGIDLDRFYRYKGPLNAEASGSGTPAATLLVNGRTSSRYLLADSDGQLRGWEYPAKGIFKGTGTHATEPAETPSKAGLPDKGLHRSAFCGIHIISPEALGMMRAWPEKFSVIDFYLTVAAEHTVLCLNAPEEAVITDIGKPSAFLNSL